MKIKALAFAVLSAVSALLPAPARAAALECDQISTGIGICLPRYGTDFDQWAASDIAALTLVNSGAASTTTAAAIAASTTALSASTVSIRAAFNAYISTNGPLVSTLGVSTGAFSIWQGTITPNNLGLNTSTAALRADFSAYVSTNGPLVSTLGQSTGTLNTTKLSSPTVSGTVGQVISLGSNGTPTWATAGTSSGTWTPTWTGFSVDPTGVATFVKIGNLVCVDFYLTGFGTGNATSLTLTLPYNAAHRLDNAIITHTYNGVLAYAIGNGDLAAGSNVFTAYPGTGSSAWGSSGNKALYFNFCYMAQ